MGHAASVLPGDTDVAKNKVKASGFPAAQPARKVEREHVGQEARGSTHPRGSGTNGSTRKAPDVTSTKQKVDGANKQAPNSRDGVPAAGLGPVAGDKLKAESEPGLPKEQQQNARHPHGEDTKYEAAQKRRKTSDDDATGHKTRGYSESSTKRGLEEGSRSGNNAKDGHPSGSNSNDSSDEYTSSSYSGSETEDEDSDDTFFVPEVSCWLPSLSYYCA